MNQCYFNGNFYQCKTATAPGESPATNPEKWSRIIIPTPWRWVLAKLTYANLLEQDGQKDKANAERDMALNDHQRGLNLMTRTEANRERFLERPQVRQRN